MRETDLRIENIDGPGDLRVLRLVGPLTLQTIFQFQAAARESQYRALVLELSGVPYMDSAGLGALVGALVAAQKAQRKLVLAGANHRLRALMDMTHVSALFPAFPDLQAAVESLR